MRGGYFGVFEAIRRLLMEPEHKEQQTSNEQHTT